MNYEELKQAAKVFHRIEMIRSYVTKERFAMVASKRFGYVRLGKERRGK